MVAKKIYNISEDRNLFTLKFLRIDHIAESKTNFGLFGYFDAFYFKKFNFVIKSLLRMVSFRKCCAIDKAEEALNIFAH